MAVEAFASYVLHQLTDKATELAREQFSLLLGVDKEIQKLSDALPEIQKNLRDAEEKQITEPDLRIWLRGLKDFAYDAEDILDEFVTVAVVHPVEHDGTGPLMNWLSSIVGEECVRGLLYWTTLVVGEETSGVIVYCKRLVSGCFLSCFTDAPSPILFRVEIANKIKAIQVRLDGFSERQKSLNLAVLPPTADEHRGGAVRKEGIRTRPAVGYILEDGFELIGRAKVKEEVLMKLIGSDEETQTTKGKKVSVVSVVGIGGVGKSALAQEVYNDERIANHFKTFRKWLSVGETFDCKALIRKLTGGGSSDMVELQEKLIGMVKGQRFLIVLDDVWNESSGEWKKLWDPLSHGEKGSRVFITSRSQKVVEATGHVTTRVLQPLSDDDCFSVFEKFAFIDGDSNEFPLLKGIGKKIVKKLKGLPLAARVVGSSLYGSRDPNKWKTVLANEVWAVAEKEDDIMPALRWSYRHLPPHLKQCFGYCSVFPKDHDFDKEDLVLKWMAVGIIQPEGNRCLEDMGRDFFDDLLSRSFFQIMGSKYRMHDLMHDLAQLVFQDECLISWDQKFKPDCEAVRHLSFHYSDECKESRLQNLHKYRKVRSITYWWGFGCDDALDVPRDLFLKFKCIRVLDLSQTYADELPDDIGELKHLRYIHLKTYSESLPDSFCDLYNLQTMKLKTFRLDRLPSGMTKLINLRKLQADDTLVSAISGIGKLTALQELRSFRVGKESGHQIAELKGLNQIRGRLSIDHLENVMSGEEAAHVRMKDKEFIDDLEFFWFPNEGNMDDENEKAAIALQEEVLEGLQPNPLLKKLAISGYTGQHFASWMTDGTLSYVTVIELIDCINLESLPPLGQLKHLKELEMVRMKRLRRVGLEFYGGHRNKKEVSFFFPSLEKLQLNGMPEWEEWLGVEEEEDRNHFPSLHEVWLCQCPRLRGLPKIIGNSIKILTISGWDDVVSLGRETLSQLHTLQELRLNSCEQLESIDIGALTSLRILFLSCPNLTTVAASGKLPSASSSSSVVEEETEATMNLNSLELAYCDNLTLLPPLYCFTALENLVVLNCPKLVLKTEADNPSSSSSAPLSSSSPERQVLSSLQYLTIDNEILLERLLRHCHLTSLKEMEIRYSNDLTRLTCGGWQRLIALQRISILCCDNLIDLPEELHCLPSLIELDINNCDKLQSLPEKGIPKSLKKLNIISCELLKERCKKDGGEDWPKIAHILDLQIE